MKKTIQLTLLLITFMSQTNIKTMAQEYDISVENEDGATIYYNYCNDGAELSVSGVNGSFYGKLVIPNEVTYDGRQLKVTTIGAWAFWGHSKLTSITIPNSVTSIEDYAFCSCSGLTSIIIPNSVTSIGGGAFYECKGIISITIPSSVNSIRGGTFYECTNLASVLIPNSVTSIENTAFFGCASLTSVTIPNSVTSIGEGAFNNTGWYNNQSEGLLYLNNWLLGYKGDIPNGDLIIENGTQGIANKAFTNCSNLTTVTIPNSVNIIGEMAFEGCTSITSIKIGNSVTMIGDGSFRNCTSLASITIGNSVTRIGDSAFAFCADLASVIIPNSVTSIGNEAFRSCTGLTSVTIGNSVTHIGYDAFSGCISLISIDIPNSVKRMDTAAFCDCTNLTSVTIGTSLTYISNYAFLGCCNLTSVTIPNNVKVIDEQAFSGCSNLTTIDFPKTMTHIGFYSFSGCSSLTSLTIPNSMTEIAEGAFYKCSSLVSVVSEIEEPFEIHPSTFDQTTYENATLYVPKGSKYKYKTTDNWNKFNIIITEGSYTLTYVVDGEEYQTINVNEADAITPIDEPTKEGYTFSGWIGVPEIMPANDVTVTGTFTVNKYKLIYTIDDKEYKTVEVEYGSTITPEQTPEGDYASFEWVGVPEIMPAHDVTVTATYTTGINGTPLSRNECNKGVNYNLNGQRIDSQPSLTVQGRKL